MIAPSAAAFALVALAARRRPAWAAWARALTAPGRHRRLRRGGRDAAGAGGDRQRGDRGAAVPARLRRRAASGGAGAPDRRRSIPPRLSPIWRWPPSARRIRACSIWISAPSFSLCRRKPPLMLGLGAHESDPVAIRLAGACSIPRIASIYPRCAGSCSRPAGQAFRLEFRARRRRGPVALAGTARQHRHRAGWCRPTAGSAQRHHRPQGSSRNGAAARSLTGWQPRRADGRRWTAGRFPGAAIWRCSISTASRPSMPAWAMPAATWCCCSTARRLTERFGKRSADLPRRRRRLRAAVRAGARCRRRRWATSWWRCAIRRIPMTAAAFSRPPASASRRRRERSARASDRQCRTGAGRRQAARRRLRAGL